MAGDAILIYYRLYLESEIHRLVGRNVCKRKCGEHQNGNYDQYLSVTKKHKVIINLDNKCENFAYLLKPSFPFILIFQLRTCKPNLFRKPTKHYNTIIWSFFS